MRLEPTSKWIHILMRPAKIWPGGETIPKTVILCDCCNRENPEWVMVSGKYLTRTVCEDCRVKYFPKIAVDRGA